jgi:hypothetical protein
VGKKVAKKWPKSALAAYPRLDTESCIYLVKNSYTRVFAAGETVGLTDFKSDASAVSPSGRETTAP